MTIALAPLSTATVHTLKGTIETLSASDFEAEKTTTVYGEDPVRGVVSTQVENGELKQRLLGRARRALGTDVVYFQHGGVWVAVPSNGAEENGNLCVPAAVVTAAAYRAVA